MNLFLFNLYGRWTLTFGGEVNKTQSLAPQLSAFNSRLTGVFALNDRQGRRGYPPLNLGSYGTDLQNFNGVR